MKCLNCKKETDKTKKSLCLKCYGQKWRQDKTEKDKLIKEQRFLYSITGKWSIEHNAFLLTISLDKKLQDKLLSFMKDKPIGESIKWLILDENNQKQNSNFYEISLKDLFNDDEFYTFVDAYGSSSYNQNNIAFLRCKELIQNGKVIFILQLRRNNILSSANAIKTYLNKFCAVLILNEDINFIKIIGVA